MARVSGAANRAGSAAGRFRIWSLWVYPQLECGADHRAFITARPVKSNRTVYAAAHGNERSVELRCVGAAGCPLPSHAPRLLYTPCAECVVEGILHHHGTLDVIFVNRLEVPMHCANPESRSIDDGAPSC
jgi:hypothetical protein